MAAKNPTPSPYRPAPIPTLPDSLPTFLAREFKGVGTALDGVLDYLPRDAVAAPDNPRSGMVRRAVSPWRPVAGQTDDEWVFFDGANWTFLDAPVTVPPQLGSYRNLLHNPLFNVQQRGAGPWSTAGYTADRWFFQFTTTGGSGSSQVASMMAATAATLGDEYAKYNYQITTTAGSGAGDVTGLQQNMEDVRRLSGKTVTVSFWAWCAAGTPKVGVELAQVFGTGGSPFVSTPGGAVTLSTTPTRYSVTMTLPSVGPKTLGTAGTDYTALTLWVSSGATNATRASNIGAQSGTFSFWGVQVEIGSGATSLERPDPADDLARCRRFYQPTIQAVLFMYQTAGATSAGTFPFPPMRVTPTITPGTNANANLSGFAYSVIPGSMVYLSGTATATGQVQFNFQYTLSADL